MRKLRPSGIEALIHSAAFAGWLKPWPYYNACVQRFSAACDARALEGDLQTMRENPNGAVVRSDWQ
jgi:hypothetical protein